MGENPLGKTSKEGLTWLTESTKKSETIVSPKESENQKIDKSGNRKIGKSKSQKIEKPENRETKNTESQKIEESETQKSDLEVRHEFKASVSLTERLMKFKLHEHQKKSDILIQALDEFLTKHGY